MQLMVQFWVWVGCLCVAGCWVLHRLAGPAAGFLVTGLVSDLKCACGAVRV